MREMITIAICLLILLISLQSGILRTGLDYDAIKKTNDNLQTANDRLTNEIRNFNRLAGRLFEGNSANAHGVSGTILKGSEDLKKIEIALSKRFEFEIKNDQIQIQSLDWGLKIILTNRLLFVADSVAPNTIATHRILQPIGRELQPLLYMEIAIFGHASDQPVPKSLETRYESLRELTFARASAIADVFEKEAGIDPAQITVAGEGSIRPVTTNDKETHRAQNDRIEIQVRSIDENALSRAREILASEVRNPPSLAPAPTVTVKPTVSASKPSKAKKKAVKSEALGEESLESGDDNTFDAGYEKPAD